MFDLNIVILFFRMVRIGITVWSGFAFAGLYVWLELIHRHTPMDQPLILTQKMNATGTSCKAAGKRKKVGDDGGDPSLTNVEKNIAPILTI